MNRHVLCLVLFCFFTVHAAAGASETQSDPAAGDPGFLGGILFGSPAFPALCLGYDFGIMELRFSGGYTARDTNGMQFDIAWEVSRTEYVHCMGLALGRSQDPGCDYSYCGPVYSMYKGRFFLELGASRTFDIRRGDFSDLPWWIVFQIGYIRHFGTT